MNRAEQNLREFVGWSTKAMRTAKVRVWEDKTMRLTLLFIVAALLVTGFTFHQYARRNYALSEGSQRRHNQALKGKLQKVNTLNQQLQELTGLTSNMPFDDHFLRKVREFKVNSIQHPAELLVNCTKQYFFDESQVLECYKTLDQSLDKMDKRQQQS